MDKVVIKQTKELDNNALEAIRGLRANLENKEGNVIVFTSVTGKEGKSFVAFGTASVMAASEKTCVYVNANLREPASSDIYAVTGVKNTLLTCLEGKCSVSDCVYETNQKGLYIVESGAPSKMAPELLYSDRYSELVNTLSEKYDYVIIDTPAVGIVSDALTIGSKASGVVLVVESEMVPYEQAQKVKKQLEMNKCNILGVVLNK